MNFLKKHRMIILRIMDLLIISFMYLLVAYLLTDLSLLGQEINKILNTILISLITYLVTFNVANIYKKITRFENGKDYLEYIFLCMASTVIIGTVGLIRTDLFMDIKSIVLANMLIAVAVVSYRVMLRFILTLKRVDNSSGKIKKNLLIIGGGEAARDVIKAIKEEAKDEYNIIGLIDDNVNKLNYTISGVKILGGRDKIVELCKKYKVDTIFFCLEKVKNKDKKEILNICQTTGARIRVLPAIVDIVKNKNLMSNLREVEIEDLLGREPVTLDNKNISELIKDRVVLVTGGGGSIGSELCRQIMKHNPKKLIIFDIYENNLYNIELELKANYNKEKIEALVGSVRDKKRLKKVFEQYRPELVFHAAAHKHVPLMEKSPLEAIKNNVFGTYNVVNCSDEFNVKRFVLISTDKAVNPTNIMGASKRLCEMIIQAKNKVSKTEFMAVRFGNVLGSNGSVVPLFKKQIAEGGPVTVTHKEITRFFMTIPEAVGLILQAITYAKGGEIFVLDMGEPVKIYDLAESLIRLSGLEPNVDIPIVITGLRPGEKLYEEILMSEEGLESTKHDKIFIAEPSSLTMNEIEEKLKLLNGLVEKENTEMPKIKEVIKQTVKTFKEPDEVNKKMREVG